MSTISASTTSTTAYKVTADTTGTLVFQTGSVPTTALTIGSDQSVTFAGAQTYTGGATFTSGITVQGITVGKGAGAVSTNTVVGYQSGYTNSTGATNVYFGYQSGYATTTSNNSFFGAYAGYNFSTGANNTAVGLGAAGGGSAAQSGSDNTAVGYHSLQLITSGGSNTAIGRDALQANTTASNNTAVGYQAGYTNTTGSILTAFGYKAGYTFNGTDSVFLGSYAGYSASSGSNTFVGASAGYYVTGAGNAAFGYAALSYASSGASGNYNTAIGHQSLQANTTASNNTAVGYQAGYTNSTGTRNTFFGIQSGYTTTASDNTLYGAYAGYGLTTGGQNCFIGSYNPTTSRGSGELVTTGTKNTILGSYSGNQGGLDIRTASNNIVLSDGDGNPRLNFVYTSSTVGRFAVFSNTTANSTNATFVVQNDSGADIICEASNYSPVGISGTVRMGKIASNNRSINAAGTVNQNGADYAEYMVKAGDFTISKGALCGINSEGKLTNVFADAVSFCVKSTDPGLVGGDSWFTEPRPKDENGNEVITDTTEYAEWFARMEAARATVDRIAFCGQVPVNVTGATAGQYIIPVNDNGAIKGVAKNEADLTMSDYIKAVGKVIAIEQDGRAKIIVKVA